MDHTKEATGRRYDSSFSSTHQKTETQPTGMNNSTAHIARPVSQPVISQNRSRVTLASLLASYGANTPLLWTDGSIRNKYGAPLFSVDPPYGYANPGDLRVNVWPDGKQATATKDPAGLNPDKYIYPVIPDHLVPVIPDYLVPPPYVLESAFRSNATSSASHTASANVVRPRTTGLPASSGVRPPSSLFSGQERPSRPPILPPPFSNEKRPSSTESLGLQKTGLTCLVGNLGRSHQQRQAGFSHATFQQTSERMVNLKEPQSKEPREKASFDQDAHPARDDQDKSADIPVPTTEPIPRARPTKSSAASAIKRKLGGTDDHPTDVASAAPAPKRKRGAVQGRSVTKSTPASSAANAGAGIAAGSVQPSSVKGTRSSSRLSKLPRVTYN